MCEKLASTEIAQSRERFEKWVRTLRPRIDLSRFGIRNDGDYVSKFAFAMWEAWQAAERDTRERCAQSTVEYLKSRGITMTNKEWDELGERIGGKV